jgi:undecaprenyl-diphosphatase
MQLIDNLLGGLPPILVYIVVGALVAGEVAITAGLVLPSATALIALGLLANAGTVGIVPALGVAVGAAWIGGTVAYHSGRRLGPGARTTRLGRWIGPKRWDRADRLFAGYGGRAIFLGQWVVVARTLVPRLAGMNAVPYRRFAAWHTPTAALWATWMVGASYALGASYDRLASRVGHASGALAVLVGMIVVLVLAGRWIGRHPDPVRAFGLLLRRITPARALARRGAPGRSWLRPLACPPSPRGHGCRQLPPGVARCGRSWRCRAERLHPLLGLGVDLALSVVPLSIVAALLVVVTPVVVRFSGLATIDETVAGWARSEWTSDAYLFALGAAASADAESLIAAAAAVSLVRWWWVWRRQGRRLRREDAVGVLSALGPVLPVAVFAVVLDWLVPAVPHQRAFAPDGWRAPDSIVFPSIAEFDGDLPPADALGALASMAASETAQLVVAVGLLTWLLTRRLPWSLRVTVWTAAAVFVAVCAGSWIYLGWSRTSETVAAVMLGAAWTALNAAIWSGRRTSGATSAAREEASNQAELPSADRGLAAPENRDYDDCPVVSGSCGAQVVCSANAR